MPGKNESTREGDMPRKRSKRVQLRVRLKKTLVAAGMERIASRRVIRGILIMLGLEQA
jgi:hypothetical protein